MVQQISNLRNFVQTGEQRVAAEAVADAHLDLAEVIGSQEDTDCFAGTENFMVRFPSCLPADDKTFELFRGQRLYQSWRDMILRLLVGAGYGLTGDDFFDLKVIAMTEGYHTKIGQVRGILTAGFGEVPLRTITRDDAIDADTRVSALQRPHLRRAFATLDELRDIQRVIDLELLRMEPIGTLPKWRPTGRREIPLPASLDAFLSQLTESERVAMKANYEIAVTEQILEPDHKRPISILMEPERFAALSSALDRVFLPSSRQACLNCLIRIVHRHWPDVAHPDPWKEVIRQLRAFGKRQEATNLYLLRRATEAASPRDVTQQVFDDALAAVEGPERLVLLRSARSFNAVILQDLPHLKSCLPPAVLDVAPSRDDLLALPAELDELITGIVQRDGLSKFQTKTLRCALRQVWRQVDECTVDRLVDPSVFEPVFARSSNLSAIVSEHYRSALRRAWQHAPTHPWRKWAEAMNEVKQAGVDATDMNMFRNRALAHDPALAPKDVTRDWIAGELAELGPDTRSIFRRGAELFANLCEAAVISAALTDNLLPIPAPPDKRRKGNAPLGNTLSRSVSTHCAFFGYARNTERSYRSALATALTNAPGVLAEADIALSSLPIDDLIKILEPRSNQDRFAHHWKSLRKIREDLLIPWTPEWRMLQEAVIGRGVASSDNPIPALTSEAVPSGLTTPSAFDREWAWRHERNMRPDLRLTFARNVARFDALRADHSIIETGLLPSGAVGAMPVRGNRAKHGVYPLPIHIDHLIWSRDSADGFSAKQLNETAHFVWRFGRDLGLLDPKVTIPASEMFHDEIVRQICASPTHGLGRGSIPEHIRRASALRRL